MTKAGGQARVLRIAANVAGCLLLVAAVVVVYGNRGMLAGAWGAAGEAPAWVFPAIALLPLANWAITSAIFWTLTRRYGRVGLWEMGALIGSAWLLNMLPFKPGLVGRVAYHKAISGIPIRTTVLVTLVALLSGGLGVLAAIGVQVAADSSLREAVPTDRLLVIAMCFVAGAAVPVILLWVRRGWVVAGSHSGDVAIAVALRIVDTHVWALRYWLAFGLIGQGQPYGVCVIVSGVSQLAGQFPIQVGVREWAVGVSTSALRGGAAVSAATVAPGMTVDLIGRAAEVVCAIPVGLVSFVWVHRRLALVGGEAQTRAMGKLPPPSGRMND
ncbi:MAG TPA: hypothetical protein PKE29_00135 [Phycisphaerales bacterium]|nr:hypothetical protein [Phycisphaerales bacterium]